MISQIRDGHAARNALLPVASRMVISIPFLMSGLVMIEIVLKWPGIGTNLFYAVGMQNMTLGVGSFDCDWFSCLGLQVDS